MICFVPMDDADYKIFTDNAVKEYAEEKALAGHWHPEESLRLSTETYLKLLPQGCRTPDNYLMRVVDVDSSTTVGVIWYHHQKRGMHSSLWIYDIAIYTEYRRRGYGEQAMKMLEVKAVEMGANKIELHVFAHNPGALSLYKKQGYVVTSLNLQKVI